MAAMVVVVGACSSSAPTQTSTATISAPSQTATAVVAESATPSSAASVNPCSDKHLVIGIITFSMTDVATNGTVKGAQDEAAKCGYTSSVVDAQGNDDTVNSAMEDYVQKKVDAIITIVTPSSAIGAGLAAAKAANIPVYTMGGDFAPGISAMGDDWMGDIVAARIAKDTGATGDMLGLVYRGGLPCLKREASYDAMLTANPGINNQTQQVPVPGQVEAATAATLAWLAGHPKGKAIWTCFDDPAMGAIAALKQDGYTAGQVLVYGFNGNPDALLAVQAGWMTATLWINHTKMGADAVDEFAKIIAAGSSWTPITIPSEYVLVDKSNVDEFLQTHPISS
jgi:ABC-type sugar transport system substrate-binding protein